MYRAVLWKEAREQAPILIALLALSAAVLAAAVQLGAAPSDYAPIDLRAYGEAPRLAAFLLAATAGVVIGGALFAGEREAGTFDVLEMLPANRWAIWRAKTVAGLTLAGGVGGLLVGEAAVLGAFGRRELPLWVGAAVLVVLLAFAWGAYGGSARTQTTLAACGVGLLSLAVFAPAVFLVLTVLARAFGRRLFGGYSEARELSLVVQATAYLLVLIPVGLGGLFFTAPDRERRSREVAPGPMRAARRRARRVGGGFGFRALVWLSFRQYRTTVLVGTGLALVAGLSMLHPLANMAFGWPGATLFAGVMAGVLGWADEQRGAARFWGERQLPVGRLWLAKVAAGLAVTLGWCVIVFLPSFVRAALSEVRGEPTLIAAFQSGLLTDAGPHVLYFVFLFMLYGFAFGHLAGLLFQKTVVAAGVGVLTAGPVAFTWVPSLLAGGLRPWQVVWVPVLALAVARLIVRPWSADRVGTRRPLTTLAAGGAALVALLGFAVWERVDAVPVIPESEDDIAFAQTVPFLDSDDGGREVRRAAGAYRQAFGGDAGGEVNPLAPATQTAAAVLPGRLYPKLGRAPRPGGSVIDELTDGLGEFGYPADRPEFDTWLDGRCRGGWLESLVEAAGKPLGPIENPRVLTAFTPLRDAATFREMSVLALARGLQQQQAGDHAVYPKLLDAVLAASRNARRQQPAAVYNAGLAVEHLALATVPRWLEHLPGRPDLLRDVADALARHDADCPTDPNEPAVTDRMIFRNTVEGPSLWAPQQLAEWAGRLGVAAGPDAVKQRAEAEATLLGFAWSVPWEAERLRRVVGLRNSGAYQSDVRGYLRGAFGIQWAGWGYPFFNVGRLIPVGTAETRLAAAAVAVRRFEADAGRVPRNLDELVPKYLPAVPADPLYAVGGVIRYRVSAGEAIAGKPADPQAGPAPPPTLPGEGQEPLAAVAGGVVHWPFTGPTGTTGRYSDPVADGGPAIDGRAVAFAAALGGFAVEEDVVPLPPPPPPDADPRQMVAVPAGRPVLWSVGNDGKDGGGTRLSVRDAYSSRAFTPGDLIVIVPAAPEPKR